MPTIYFDHAATSFPKPPAVRRAMETCMQRSGGNPGRGSHRLAARAADVVYDCRETAGTIFGTTPERVVFTGGATMSLNLAIRGLVRPGDHVLVDNMAHNAVYRPLHRLATEGRITFDVYDATGPVEAVLASLVRLAKPNTRLVVATHMSNICSLVEPIGAVGQLCRERGWLFVVDGAQSGGHLPIHVTDMGITALCLPGHKGLLGPQGVGLLLFHPSAPDCAPLLTGGSGTHSLDPTMPTELPEHLEAGTLPTPAIAGLHAGLSLWQSGELAQIAAHAVSLGERFTEAAGAIPGLGFYGKTGGAVLSFGIEGISPARIAAVLDENGICVRSGYHCAPLAHRTIGSLDTGTVRVSFGHGNTERELDRCVAVLRRLRDTT